MSEQVEHIDQSSIETNTNNNGSSRLPLRKRIGPVLKWQPVETPEEHSKQNITYPQSYPIQALELVSDGGGDTTETDEEKKASPASLTAITTTSNTTTTTTTTTTTVASLPSPTKRTEKEETPSSRPTKKVKRGRPPLQKNNTTDNSPVPVTPTTPPLPQQRLPTENNTLYCICKRPYDPKEFMIACDRCNEWFHGECIEISEKQSEFIDLYYCESCAKLTGKKTLWKPKCANPACVKPARIGTHQGHLSKYCSDTCGLQVARARIELAEMKKRGATMSMDEQPYNPLSRAKLSSFADMDDRARLSRVKEEKLHAKSMITMGEHKSTLLNLLIQKTGEDVCGFDSRLSWPDTLWEKVDHVTEGDQIMLVDANGSPVSTKAFSVCSQSRKCNKHLNWQKLKTSELEQERSEQFIILSMLERERQQIKARMKKRREEVDLVDFLDNGTITHC